MIRLLVIALLLFPSLSFATVCTDPDPSDGVAVGNWLKHPDFDHWWLISEDIGEVYGTGNPVGCAGTWVDEFNGVVMFYTAINGSQCTRHDYRYSSSMQSLPAATCETCNDGIANQDECAIDVGGVCGGSCEPSTCSDGVVSGAETGIDCGDAACTGDETCTTYCPVGFVSETRPPDNMTACYSADDTADYTVDAKLGVCPSGMFKSSTDADKCVSWALPTFASGDYLDPVTTDPADSTPWNNVFTQDNTEYANSTNTVDGVTTDIDTTTVTGTSDDGSAISDVTTTTTVTQADGSKVETTVQDTSVKAADGTVTGGTITTTKNYAPTGELVSESVQTENIESEQGAGAAFSAPGEGTGYVVDGETGGQFATRFDEFKTAVDGSAIMQPISGLFAGPDTSSKTPLYSLGMGSYGTKSFDLSTYDSVFSAIGALFIFLSTLAAARMIMVKGA